MREQRSGTDAGVGGIGGEGGGGGGEGGGGTWGGQETDCQLAGPRAARCLHWMPTRAVKPEEPPLLGCHTDWEGMYIIMEQAAPMKWCEPSQGNHTEFKKLILRSQSFYVCSQLIGFYLFLGYVVLCVQRYIICMCCQPQEPAKQSEDIAMA
ncbi:hypothetical protein GN956_G1446 [Arapaima gigas]